MQELRKIQIDNLVITYTLVRKQVKNVNLRIERDSGIVVSANPYVPVEKIDAFVAEKIAWILKKQEAMQKRQSIMEHQNQKEFYYLGKAYEIVFEKGKPNVRFEDGDCIVSCHDRSQVKGILEQFERIACQRLYPKVMQEVFEMFALDYPITMPKLKIRNMTSRWGSCIPSKNQITLNQKMLAYDPIFLKYVTIHEFAHLIQPNHSKQFWHIVEKMMPDYKKVRHLPNQLDFEE